MKTLPMRDLLVAVDLSGSMETEDFTDAEGRTIDRLSAVKQVLGEFLDRREDDRIALLVFGSAAFVQVPFTEDNEVIAQLLDETTVRMAGPRTMLGDAIGLAITLERWFHLTIARTKNRRMIAKLMPLVAKGDVAGASKMAAAAPTTDPDSNPAAKLKNFFILYSFLFLVFVAVAIIAENA